MAIILVAHVPGNPVTEFIPARFGPSDAAEMFVFCSGFASAIAFGGTFRRAGFALGTPLLADLTPRSSVLAWSAPMSWLQARRPSGSTGIAHALIHRIMIG